MADELDSLQVAAIAAENERKRQQRAARIRARIDQLIDLEDSWKAAMEEYVRVKFAMRADFGLGPIATDNLIAARRLELRRQKRAERKAKAGT